MEESPQQEFDNPQPDVESESPSSYWTAVATAGVIFGIAAFIISIIASYAIINSEPTGSFFNPTQFIGTFACLIAAFGGMLATWLYAKEHNVAIKLGRGALIGFLTGVCITVVSVLLSQIWQLIDPDMVQRMLDSMIANVEAMDLPQQQKQQTIDMMAQNFKSRQSIFSQLIWGIPINGILNIITGMIGAKIFGKKEEL